MDGLPALELWDLIVSVLGNISRVSDRSGKDESHDHKHHKSHNKIDVMKEIDAVPSNVQSARQEALLFVFEDNEAAIKMIKKSYNETCFPNSELLLNGCLIKLIWTSKSKSNTSTPKTNSQTS